MEVAVDDPALISQVEQRLPPVRRAVTHLKSPSVRFSVLNHTHGRCDLLQDGQALYFAAELHRVLDVLDAQVRMWIAQHTPNWVFIHAGVVAVDGRALILPGRTLSGKSTLVAELVRAGALYGSDEYAVLDSGEGLVHPYARPLSIRGTERAPARRVSVAELGGTSIIEPLPVALVVITRFKVGGIWRPSRLSVADGALAVLANAILARVEPTRVLTAARLAAQDALVLEGERGEARVAAAELMATLRSPHYG